MKNRKGSVLVLVFMVFVVLSILAITSISLMLTNNNQALAHRKKIQAYYIARGGAEAVEAAILKMKAEEIKSLDEALKKPEELNIEDIDIGSEVAQVRLSKDEKGNIEIESTAQVGKSSETVNKVMEKTGGTEGNGIEDFEMPVVEDAESGYKKIDGIKYKIVEDIDSLKLTDGKNYYVEGKVEIKSEKSINIKSNIYAEKGIDISTKKGAITTENKIMSGENITISIKDEGDIKANGDIISKGGLTMSTKKGAITISNKIISGKNIKIDITDEGKIKANGDIISKGELTMSTKKGAITTENKIMSGENITISIKDEGDIKANGDIISKGGLTMSTKKGAITISNKIISGKNIIISITDEGDIKANGDIISKGGLTMSTRKGAITISNKIISDGDITIYTKDEGNITAYGDIISARNISIVIIKEGKKTISGSLKEGAPPSKPEEVLPNNSNTGYGPGYYK